MPRPFRRHQDARHLHTVQSDGAYGLYVEAAREHVPYELIQQDIAFGAQAASFTLAPRSELTGVVSEK